MPLHLLSKKSWNVYNPENIARVRRDEAAAQAQDEKRERQERSNEAETRVKLLKGEEVLTLSESREEADADTSGPRSSHEASRKRRRLNGEDDTDRDIRLAKLDAQATAGQQRAGTLFDSEGHIDLIPRQPHKSKTKVESEQQYDSVGMRFSDAGGYKTKSQPWYSSAEKTREENNMSSKDVWGNDDPRRQQREQQRIATNDPLAAMKKGVKQLRENEKQRKEWMAQRERDLYEVEKLARRHEKRRRRRSNDEDSLDGFNLDAPPQEHAHSMNGTRESGRDSSRRYHRSRNRSGSRERRHHRHRHREISSNE